MTLTEAEQIMTAIYDVFEYIGTLHITGGGEPFLHPQLPELIETVFRYADKFDHLMLFSNSAVKIKPDLLKAIQKHKEKIIVQLSQYGINIEQEQSIAQKLQDSGVNCKIEKYYGDDQSFGGWIDFGSWDSYGRKPDELEYVFKTCSVTNVLKGNWRTRDGKVHWCSRSQRGMELGLIPNDTQTYVDLFDDTSVDEKREKFERIANAKYISACNYCSGDAGTNDTTKRYKAAEQEVWHETSL